MPLVAINAELPGHAADPQRFSTLDMALHRLPADHPIVVLIHGFKFSPFDPARDPHGHILSLNPPTGCRKARSWPRALGFDGVTPRNGLCIGFGWEATGSIWQAYGRAGQSGGVLAKLIERIHQLRPNQQIDILAHSLGARVALSALPHLPAHTLRRMILMTPAETMQAATRALESPAGRSTEFINVTSRENDLYDFAFEWLIAPHRLGDRSLSHRCHSPLPNWLTLQIDQGATLQALRDLGFQIAAPEHRICHWSTYLRPGIFSLYRALLASDLPLEELRSSLPDRSSPRWSRLIARPRAPRILPFARKAPS